MREFLLAVTFLSLILNSTGRTQDLTFDTAPPVVVKTVPQAGGSDVDWKLTDIQVTFSKDMRDGAWSWVKVSDATFPKMEGSPKYLADKRTCVLHVKLEPNKTYVIWINSAKYANFVDLHGLNAVPYLLVFRTKT